MPFERPTLGKLKLGGYSLDLDYILTREYDDIAEASSEIPPVIEWVSSMHQSMFEEKLRLRQKIKAAEAGVYMELKSGTFEESYAGKATEAAIERAVQLDSRVQKVHDEFAVHSGWCSRLSNLILSLQSKLELTRSTEATRRRLMTDDTGESIDEI